jgi:hypothetical protein
VAGATCRDEVLEAFERLRKATGRTDFTPVEVIAQMRAAGSAYRDSTIRTHVVAHMPAAGLLVRVGPGRYRLPRDRHLPPEQAAASDESASERVTEDEVKAAVKAWLEAAGWTVVVAWGRQRGIDIDARRGPERLIIEAKGEALPGPQQVNYFLNAFGEIVQRMDDPVARHGLALPDHRQYRGLVDRLPALARERLRLDVFFVRRSGSEYVVEKA